MSSYCKVFDFTIHIDGIGLDNVYVVASTTEKAEEKLEQYRKQRVENGFADFRPLSCFVEIDNVIT